MGIYLPCYDILRNSLEELTSRNSPSLTPYVPLVSGAVARSLACITCYPIELARTRMQVLQDCINIMPMEVLFAFHISYGTFYILNCLTVFHLSCLHYLCYPLRTNILASNIFLLQYAIEVVA